jgi:hypothetical protein
MHVTSWTVGDVTRWAADVVGLCASEASLVPFTGSQLLAWPENHLVEDLQDAGLSPASASAVAAAVKARVWRAPTGASAPGADNSMGGITRGAGASAGGSHPSTPPDAPGPGSTPVAPDAPQAVAPGGGPTTTGASITAGIDGSGPVGAPPRHPCKFRAFVVGNNAYHRVPPLAKCVNDARAMAALLRRKGYVVTILEDARVDSFARDFYNFACSLSAGCTVVVHFSGHGFQAAGANRLLFVDQAKVDAAKGAIMMEPLYLVWSTRPGWMLVSPRAAPLSSTQADRRSSLDAIISLARDQLIAAHELEGQEASASSITVFLDACRSDGGLATTAVRGSDSDK